MAEDRRLAEQTANAFAAHLASMGKATNTVAAYRRDVLAYLRWRGADGGAGADEEGRRAAYLDVLAGSKRSSSAARAVVALRTYHRWAAPGDTAASFGGPRPRERTEPTRPGGLDVDEAARVLAVARGHSLERRRCGAAVALLYLGGLKAGEAIALDVSDVDLAGRRLVADRHGAHRRTLPLAPTAVNALRRWLAEAGRARVAAGDGALLVNRRGGRLSRQGLWLITRFAATEAGVATGASPNDLRRSCGAHLVALGLDAALVEAFLGHARGPLPSVSDLDQLGWGAE